MYDLYKNIKERRKELGLTQTELAEKTGYNNKSSIATIESGRVDLPLDKLKIIAEALETTPSELLGWNQPGIDFNVEQGQKDAVLIKEFHKLNENNQKELMNYLHYLSSNDTSNV